jgi:hypothetical protein
VKGTNRPGYLPVTDEGEAKVQKIDIKNLTAETDLPVNLQP